MIRCVFMFIGLLLLAGLMRTPSQAAKLAVETPQLEPTFSTIPPMQWIVWFPMVVGGAGATD